MATTYHGLINDSHFDCLTLIIDKYVPCSIWVARRPPGYAFLEFDDRRDALDAIHALDG